MRRAVLGTAALLLCAGFLGLLPKSREPEELTLLTQVAVDREGARVVVTALAGARWAEDEEPQIMEGKGSSLDEAFAALENSPLRRPYLGQVETLLVGPGEKLDELLPFVLNHRALKTDMILYAIVGGSAGKALTVWAEETKGASPPQDPDAVTVGEALADMTQGRSLNLAPLTLDGDQLVWEGAA